MKKHTIIFLIGMVYSNVCHATTLLESLQKYCVPKSGAGCEENVRATYDEDKGYCTCNSITKRYDAEKRSCEDCIPGSFASNDWKSCETICPVGFKAELIKDNVCPNGYVLHTITNNNDCPSGYKLGTYNPITKTLN